VGSEQRVQTGRTTCSIFVVTASVTTRVEVWIEAVKSWICADGSRSEGSSREASSDLVLARLLNIDFLDATLR
jgi:hypothetical protein